VIPADLLRRVPGCEDGRSPLITQPLTGGRGCNAVWRVETTRGRFVLRVRGEPVDRPGSLSRNELLAHRLAAEAGAAPALLDAAEDGRWLLMDYIGEPWTDSWLQSAWGLAALGSRLRLLQAIEAPPGSARLDAAQIAQGYARLALARDPSLAPVVEAGLGRVHAAAAPLAGLARRAALNHGDLQAPNVVGTRPMLVDWEYAQWADPVWDVACLLEYYPGLRSRSDAVLEACGLGSREDRHILSLQQALFASLNSLWSLSQGGAG
jgi:hypothetical protein